MFGFVFPSIPKPGAAGQPRALSQHTTGRRTLAKCRTAHQLIQIAQTPVLYAVFFLIILDTVMYMRSKVSWSERRGCLRGPSRAPSPSPSPLGFKFRPVARLTRPLVEDGEGRMMFKLAYSKAIIQDLRTIKTVVRIIACASFSSLVSWLLGSVFWESLELLEMWFNVAKGTQSGADIEWLRIRIGAKV